MIKNFVKFLELLGGRLEVCVSVVNVNARTHIFYYLPEHPHQYQTKPFA